MKILRPKLIVPVRDVRTPIIPMRPQNFGVSWTAEVLDRRHRVLASRSGRNMITDHGMDQLASVNIGVGQTAGTHLIDFLHVGDTTQTMKRVAGGPELTIDYSGGAADLDITTNSNFFEAGDNGRTLLIDGFPEILIDGFSSATAVHGTARGGVWLPGFNPATPGTGPHTDFGVHYTNVATLASQTQRFNTYDTGAANFRATVNDSANSRWICQRIFLGAEVTGSAWTVNQLGWGSSASTTNCFGKVNLAAPLVVPVGNKLRVHLQVYSAYTPINLSAVTLDWGATVGSYTADVRQERIGKEAAAGGNTTDDNVKNEFNALNPYHPSAGVTGHWTSAFSLDNIAWKDDAGFTSLSSRTRGTETVSMLFSSTYTNGTHTRTRRWRWPDTVAFSAATGLYAGANFTGSGAGHWPHLSIKPTANINKPSGHWIEVQIPLHWTRELIN